MKKACFLDRDGVLIEEKHYLKDPNQVVLIPGVISALLRLKEAGYLLVVVSNQAGVAKGFFSIKEFYAVQNHLDYLLRKSGVLIDDWQFCPHHPQGIIEEYTMPCQCRKPLPGMLFASAKKLQIDFSQSIMIGDKQSDLAAGHHAGCRHCMLVLTGHGEEEQQFLTDSSDLVFDNLSQAVNFFLEHSTNL